MAEPQRRLRRLLYALGEVESALRTAGRSAGADSVGQALKRTNTLLTQDFLDDSRMILEEVLLGERDLPTDAIGLILDAMADIDDDLREVSAEHHV